MAAYEALRYRGEKVSKAVENEQMFETLGCL